MGGSNCAAQDGLNTNELSMKCMANDVCCSSGSPARVGVSTENEEELVPNAVPQAERPAVEWTHAEAAFGVEETVPTTEQSILKWKPLVIEIVGATGLRAADWGGKSDPYCICQIEGKPFSRFETQVIDHTLDPVWNAETQFRAYEPGDALIFSIYDKDRFKKDDFLGKCSLDSVRFHPDGFSGKVHLEDAGKKQNAYLEIRIPQAVQIEPPKPKAAPPQVHQIVQVARTEVVPKAKAPPPAKPVKKDLVPLKDSGNQNTPKDYMWLEEVLKKLANNEAAELGCKEASSKKTFIPMFFAIGSCPSALCGMQAVMFLYGCDKHIHFWWVKPAVDKKHEVSKPMIEKETLILHDKGPHKNDPGRSRSCFQPLADIFEQSKVMKGWRFGVEPNDGVPKCFIVNDTENGTKLYLHLLWLEDWTTNPFARSKYIKGKLMFSKSFKASDGQFNARQFEIHDGDAFISDHEEDYGQEMLPSGAIKQLYDFGWEHH